MSDLPNRPLRVDEVAAYWSISVRTVYLWIENGHLKRVPAPSGSIVRVTRESVIGCKLGNRTKEVA